MKITEIDHGLALNQPAPGYVRSPGLHMSDIYNSLYEEMEPSRFKKSEKGPNAAIMEVGSAFEEALEIALAHRLMGERPGEFAATPAGLIVPVGTPGSIIFSPDNFLYEPTLTLLGEFKATKMSIKHGIEDKKFDKWFTQMKSYGKPLRMRRVRLYVLFLMGDWSFKPPHGETELRAWDIEFTQRELDDNWAMLMRHAKKKGMIV